MKIAIVGAGAIGSLMAGVLSRGGLDVSLIGRDPVILETLMRQGLRLTGVRGSYQTKPAIFRHGRQAGPADLVVLCVKAYDTAAAMEEHRALVGGNTLVLSLQNGIGNVEILADLVGREHVLAGMTTMGANVTKPGVIHHAGEGETAIGELTGARSERTAGWAEILTKAGWPARAVADVRTLIWGKLCINVAINAVTAILGVNTGQLVELKIVQSLVRDAVAETVAVAARQGMVFDLDERLTQVWQVIDKTRDNRTSMLVDIQRGRRTEIEAINGAVSRLGNQLGVPTPVNDTLTRLVQAKEKARAIG